MILLLIAALLAATPVRAAEPVDGVSFQTLAFADTTIDVVTVDLRKAKIELFWRDEHGSRLARLHAVRDRVEHSGRRAVAITNAGIFAPATPSGLHLENGREQHPLNLTATDGNFGMKPNGVFLLDRAGAAIVESSALAAHPRKGLRLATQSGPLLLERARIHPRFQPSSTSALPRSGVGVVSPDRVVFAVTRGPIRFFDFARLFQERLGCNDALYLDGNISRLWAPSLGLDADGGDFMGILAVSVPRGEPQR